MTNEQAQTKWAIQVWILAPAAYQSALNTRWENHGYGPDNFSVGLSANGYPPAVAYHCMSVLKLSDFPELIWLAANAPKCWIWIRARDDVLKRLIQWHKDRIDAEFDKGQYRDVKWQTRSHAYIHHSTSRINVPAALQWLRDNADPLITLQPIDEV